MNKLVRKLSCFYDSRMLLLLIIALGIALRLVLYLENHSLWLDESMLALNIVNRSFSQLLHPLDYNQGAPIGFLMVEKLATVGLGNGEYALRLFPLLTGIASLFLFYALARKCLSSKAVPIALGLFAILPSLVNYSSEVKQYSGDVAVSLLLTLLIVDLQSKKLTALRSALLGIGGAIAIWFSHPAVFVLGGTGITLAIFGLMKKDWPGIRRLAVIYSTWLSSFVICYFVSLGKLSANKALANYWREGFMPSPNLSFDTARWIFNAVLEFLGHPEGLSLLPGAALLILIIGCISLSARKKEVFCLLIAPVFFVLVASGLHKYPFKERLLLFIIPAGLLFIAEGAEAIRIKAARHLNAVRLTVIGILFLPPLLYTGRHIGKPYIGEEIKPALSYLKEHWRDGDRLYLYYHSWFPFRYYCDRYGFTEKDYLRGLPPWGDYVDKQQEHLDRLRGQSRTWLLMSHIVPAGWKGQPINDEELYLNHLDGMGRRLDSFKTTGAALYLYDLSGDGEKTEK